MALKWLTLLVLFLSASSELSPVEKPFPDCSLFNFRQLPNGKWIVRFEAPRAGLLKFRWTLTFATSKPSQKKHWLLEHYPSEEENLANIRNGGLAQVFLTLEESEYSNSTLLVVELNGEVLCRNPSNPDPDPATINLALLTYTVQPQVRADFEECGQEGFVTTQHGGNLVTRGQYPWLATLLEGSFSISYKCVVSVISKRTVITAAHCIYGKPASQLWVYLGRHDRNQNPESGAALVGVSNVLTPPQYSGNPLPDSDVGLLVLKDPIWFTRYIQPLCMWSSELPVPPREGDTGTVAGWGYDESGQKTRYPKAVSVRLVARDQCLRKMKKAEDFITERTVCAGNSESHGPCFGDSGAALIVLRNNRWVMRGIVSISPSRGETCDLSSYTIYCDVSQHLDWIEQNIVR